MVCVCYLFRTHFISNRLDWNGGNECCGLPMYGFIRRLVDIFFHQFCIFVAQNHPKISANHFREINSARECVILTVLQCVDSIENSFKCNSLFCRAHQCVYTSSNYEEFSNPFEWIFIVQSHSSDVLNSFWASRSVNRRSVFRRGWKWIFAKEFRVNVCGGGELDEMTIL